MTNNKFFETIYKPYQEQHMTKYTCYTRCNIIERRLLNEHGEETPKDISNIAIERIYDGMEADGLKQNTIFGTYAALYSFFRMAAEYGEVGDNPVRLARTINVDILSYSRTCSKKTRNRRRRHDER